MDLGVIPFFNDFKSSSSVSHQKTGSRHDLKFDRIRIVSQLNGNNGEVTGSDDVRRGRRTVRNVEARLISVVQRALAGNKKKAPRRRRVKQSQKPSTRVPRGIAVSGSMPAALHHDTQRGLIAYADGFSPQARGVGGVVDVRRSQKVTARTSFIVTAGPGTTVGSNGTDCYIFISPCLCSDYPSFMVATCTDTNELYSGVGATTTIYDRFYFNTLPYNNTEVGIENPDNNDVVGRVISVTLKLRNITAPLHRCGEIAYLETPTHAPLVTTASEPFLDISTYMNSFETIRRINATDGGEHVFSVHPHTEAELHYKTGTASNNSTPNSYLYPYAPSNASFGPGGSGSWGSPIAVVVISAPSTNTYRCEAIAHVEYTGHRTHPFSTLVRSDEQGGRMCAQVVAHAKSEHHADPHKHLKTLVFPKLFDELKSHASSKFENLLKNEVLPGIRSAGADLLAGLL